MCIRADCTLQMDLTEPKRILVVDGDPAFRGLMSGALEACGHQVEIAADGEAAWRALLSKEYDLLVTCDVMPKASGLDLVRRLRVAVMEIPVIVASDRLDEEDVKKISRDPWARFNGFVHKPFQASELLATVNSVLLADASRGSS